MRKILIHNRAAEKIISVYWFAVLFIVAAAVVYMVFSFYGKPYDIRGIEADILADKVADCFSKGGDLRDEVLEDGFEENFLAICNLNFEVEDVYDWKEQTQYYMEVDLQIFPSGNDVFNIKTENEALKSDCGMQGKNFPVCLERSFYVIDEKEGVQTQYKVNILSIVKKIQKNVQ